MQIMTPVQLQSLGGGSAQHNCAPTPGPLPDMSMPAGACPTGIYPGDIRSRELWPV